MNVGYMPRNMLTDNLDYTIIFSSNKFDEKNFRVYCNEDNIIEEVRKLSNVFVIDKYCNIHVNFENKEGVILQRNMVATIII